MPLLGWFVGLMLGILFCFALMLWLVHFWDGED